MHLKDNAKPVLHRAKWIMTDPWNWIENAGVEIAGTRLEAIRKTPKTRKGIDHGDGVILPPLGNAHTHLSLSALKAKVETGRGFVRWVDSLIAAREKITPLEALQAAAVAAGEMKRRGTGYAAEVGPLEPGRKALKTGGLAGVCFVESLGSDGNSPELPMDGGDVKVHPAAHGLHSTSPEKLVRLKSAGRRFALHLAESEAETKFLAEGKGEWAQLMAQRGHDLSKWAPWGERPVKRASRLNLLGPATLAVHLLEVDSAEIGLIAESGTRVCLCPRSNWTLHGKLPDIEAFFRAGVRPALGTDSLASVDTLDAFDEMAFTAAHYPGLSPETVLSLATVNAAAVLDLAPLGRLRVGQNRGLIHVPLEAKNPKEAAAMLVSGRPREVMWL